MRAMRCLFAVLCLPVLILLGACSRAESPSKPLLLGLSDWPGYAPFYAAAKLGLYRPTSIEIKSFGSNFDLNRAFVQRRLDVLATPLFDALRIADEGVPLKIILLCDYSNGGDGIVARREIASVRDLRGKKVAVELGAITHFVLLSALAQARIAESDVQLVNLSIPEAVSAFEQGKLDAATLWDPHFARLASAPNAHRIFSSKEIPGQVIDVLIVHKDVAEERPEDVRRVVRAWEEVLAARRQRPAEIEETMAREMNRTPEELRADFAGLELLDLAKNRELYAPGPEDERSARRAYAATVDFMVRHQLLKRPAPEAGEILDARFLDAAAN